MTRSVFSLPVMYQGPGIRNSETRGWRKEWKEETRIQERGLDQKQISVEGWWPGTGLWLQGPIAILKFSSLYHKSLPVQSFYHCRYTPSDPSKYEHLAFDSCILSASEEEYIWKYPILCPDFLACVFTFTVSCC